MRSTEQETGPAGWRVDWPAVALGLAVAQPAVSALSRVTGIGTTEAEQARADEGPVTPAGGAFAIWGPLFAASISYAARAVRDDRRGDGPGGSPEARSIARLMALAFAGDVAWSLNAQLRRLDWASVALISTAAAAAATALRTATGAADTSEPAAASANRIGGLAGWLLVAGFANLETTLNLHRGRPPAAQEDRRAAALIAAAAATASGLVAATRATPSLVATAGWGLGGILLKAVRRRNRPAATSALLGLAGLGSTAIAVRRAAAQARG